MATHKFTPIQGKRVRVTSLDECGRVTSESKSYVSDGFVSVNISSEVEEGAEILTKKFTGALCVNEKNADSFKYFTLELEFCGVDPALLSIVSNAKDYKDAGNDVAGFTVAEGTITKKFALEMWVGLSGQACEEGAQEASGYLLLPFIQSGVIGSLEFGSEDSMTFSLSGARTRGGNGWGKGPHNVVYGADQTPAPLPTALDPLDHLLLMDTGLAVPAHSSEPTKVVPVSR